MIRIGFASIKTSSNLAAMYGIFERPFSISLWNISVARLTPYRILVGCLNLCLCLSLNTFAIRHRVWLVNTLLLNHFWKTFNLLVFSKIFLLKMSANWIQSTFIICANSNSTISFWNNSYWAYLFGIRNRFKYAVFYHSINFCFNYFFHCKRQVSCFHEFGLWICFNVYFSSDALNFS